MFSDKNYGLPKDLIEAAKRVHEKQLMEYDEDGYINNPPKGMDKGTKKDRETAAKMGLKGPHLVGVGRAKQKLPPLPTKKPQSEEVQFTEEELAEAFAIFLEENFHVEMLTEEDLDYVFEEEFPQWLEEGGLSQAFARPERTGISAKVAAKMMGRPIISQSSQDAHVGLTRGARRDKKGISSRKKILKANPPTTKTDQTTREGRPVTSGGTLPSSMVQGDTEGGYTSAPKPTSTAPKPAVRKPASTARNQVRRPSSTGTKSSVYKPQSRIMKDTGAAAPDFGNNNATFDAENKPVFKSDTETRRAANLRTISKRKRQAPTRRAPTRRASTRQSTGRPSWAEKAFTSEN